MKRLGFIATLAAVLCLPATVWAEPDLPRCIDGRGYNVIFFEDASLAKLAEIDNADDGWPLVRYNADALPQLDSKTRMFFFYHQCGHHVLGHALKPDITYQMEEKADCWAVNSLFYSGRLRRSEFKTVQKQISALSEKDWRKVGPRRALRLANCLR